MNDLSKRLALAIDYIKEAGYERFDSSIARKIGVGYSTLNMAKSGERAPTWGMLLNLCDRYPVSFWWLREGSGKMTDGRTKREQALREKVMELEGRIRELEGKE